ncbi:Flp family type IVb pilin [Vibrio rarus]|uniref:Flp family type IVb pilin n=1 Tax=Vibrio rarus TaxID=413403 RepID=UPI0021C4B208|nr:Flp family type IVb pilin [Vibrio rarus]
MFKAFLTRFIKDERGVTAIEYGVIGVALAVGLGFAMSGTGGDGEGFVGALQAAFENIASEMGIEAPGAVEKPEV